MSFEEGKCEVAESFFFALWVRRAALSYRHRRKLEHALVCYCAVSAYASRFCVQTSDACTGLLSCYSEELRTVELSQIKDIKKTIRPLLAATLNSCSAY